VRRLLARALPAAAAALLLCAPTALAGAFTPESGGSPNADEISSLYKLTLVIAMVVFVGVEGALIYSLVKFRARKGRTAAQIHGNTRLEIGWTIIPALILVLLTVVTFLKLGAIQDPQNSDPSGLRGDTRVLEASTKPVAPPDGQKLNVCVTGRQYIWRFTYAPDCRNAYGKPYTYTQLTVPAHTTVTLDIQSTDVAHSWWIPKLGGKFDAIPGYHNYTWFKAPTPGKFYSGTCAELCGRNHANMTATVRVVTPSEYQTFMTNLTANISAANKRSSQLRDALHRAGQL
jgi:cytochrome c oxidase subunit 2